MIDDGVRLIPLPPHLEEKKNDTRTRSPEVLVREMLVAPAALDTNRSFLFCRAAVGRHAGPRGRNPEEQRGLHLSPVRQSVSDETQSSETFKIRMRRAEALRMLAVSL